MLWEIHVWWARRRELLRKLTPKGWPPLDGGYHEVTLGSQTLLGGLACVTSLCPAIALPASAYCFVLSALEFTTLLSPVESQLLLGTPVQRPPSSLLTRAGLPPCTITGMPLCLTCIGAFGIACLSIAMRQPLGKAPGGCEMRVQQMEPTIGAFVVQSEELCACAY